MEIKLFRTDKKLMFRLPNEEKDTPAYELFLGVLMLKPEQIKAIYLPEFLKERIIEHEKEEKLLPDFPVTWCKMNFSEWDRPFTPERLKMFADTAPLSAFQFNYFRGVDERRHMIDIDKDHIVYDI